MMYCKFHFLAEYCFAWWPNAFSAVVSCDFIGSCSYPKQTMSSRSYGDSKIFCHTSQCLCNGWVIILPGEPFYMLTWQQQAIQCCLFTCVGQFFFNPRRRCTRWTTRHHRTRFAHPWPVWPGHVKFGFLTIFLMHLYHYKFSMWFYQQCVKKITCDRMST